MSDIADLENRLNQKFTELSREIAELKSILGTMSSEEVRRLDDIAAKTTLNTAEIRKFHEKLDRAQDSVDAVSSKIQN